MVTNGATLQCSQGTAPSTLTVLPNNNVDGENQPAATINDYQPNVNIMPFGMCITLANPQVAAATAAALGVLTPQPCIPMTTAPWTPGSSTVMAANQCLLTNDSTCNCQWTGVIEIKAAGQTTNETS